MRHCLRLALSVLLLSPPIQAQDTPTELAENCRASIRVKLAGEKRPYNWNFGGGVYDQLRYDAERGISRNLLFVIGDFDADKRQDIAFLMDTQTTKHRDLKQIGVCLSTKQTIVILLDAPCSDGIAAARFEGRDAIDSLCLAQKTYTLVYEGGSFKQHLTFEQGDHDD